MSTDINPDERKRSTSELIDSLEQKLAHLKQKYDADIEKLAAESKEQVAEMNAVFIDHLKSIQHSHEQDLRVLEEEINFFKEMSVAQKSMMESNFAYFQEKLAKLRASSLE